MNSSQYVDDVAIALYDSMSSELLASFGGGVSIAKFLGELDDDGARQSWSTRISRELAELPPNALNSLVIHQGSATVSVSNEVVARFGLGEVTVSISGDDVWEAALRPGFSVAIIAGLGWSRWGQRWVDELRRVGLRRGPIVDIGDGRALHWVAQRPDEPGPWTCARSAEGAALISDAESLGTPRLREMYEELNRD